MAPDDSTPEDTENSGGELLPEDRPAPEADLLPDDPAEDLAPEPPTVPELSADDASSELKRQFWSLVLLFNVALFGMSLGVMLVGFEGRWEVGGALVAVGAFAFARGWHGYRKATGDGSDATRDEADTAGDAADATDAAQGDSDETPDRTDDDS